MAASFVVPGSGVKNAWMSVAQGRDAFDLRQDGAGQRLDLGSAVETKDGTILRTDEFAGEKKKIVTEFLKGEGRPVHRARVALIPLEV